MTLHLLITKFVLTLKMGKMYVNCMSISLILASMLPW